MAMHAAAGANIQERDRAGAMELRQGGRPLRRALPPTGGVDIMV